MANKKEKEQNVIRFDMDGPSALGESKGEPKWIEQIHRDENGGVLSYALVRNPKYKEER